MNTVVGIDIAKDKFDVCLWTDEGAKLYETFDNNKKGINKLHTWLKNQGAQQAHLCLEATGVYGELLAETMHKRRYPVSVVNPSRIKAYADSQLRRNKTDKLDAALIADFCRTQNPPLWVPPSPEVKELRAMVRHYNTLKEERQRAKNRLGTQRSDVVKRQLKAQIKLLDSQIADIRDAMKKHVDRFPDLKKDRDLLDSIPGIGDLTACVLLAELGDIKRFDDVREVVAFVGLNPQQYQSGKTLFSRGISRMGRASLRAALYMPALTAIRFNPILHAFAQRLEHKSRLTNKQIIAAVMRKLLHLAFGILKSGQAFDANYQHQMPLAA